MLRMISKIPCSNTIHHFLNNSCNIIVGSSRLRETVHRFFSLLAESIVSRSIGTLSHGATSLRSCHQPMLPSQPNDCLHSGDISGRLNGENQNFRLALKLNPSPATRLLTSKL